MSTSLDSEIEIRMSSRGDLKNEATVESGMPTQTLINRQNDGKPVVQKLMLMLGHV